jgi:3',5'-cyclic AMP phosphodiesterase CpdA
MKFVQITDLHIVPSGGVLHDLDPAERLARCVADINRHREEMDFCVFTGDLADRGEREAYELLREILVDLEVPHHLMLGNHDARGPFLDVFSDAPRDQNGFVQSQLVTDEGNFLFLDTLDEGNRTGVCCEQRREWLGERLREAGSRPVYLFMHHPPFDIGIPSMDNIKLDGVDSFARVLEDSANIRHLFFGHVHRPVSGSWHGIPFSALPSTNHQIGPDFVNVAPMPYTHGPAAYAIVHLRDDQLVVHTKFVDE